MGECYNTLKDFKMALKCHKKQLEISWQCNDVKEELRSYEQIGKQYFYLGDMKKAKYYSERATRGLVETDDSNIKLIFTSFSTDNREK